MHYETELSLSRWAFRPSLSQATGLWQGAAPAGFPST